MKTTFIILLTALVMSITGTLKAQETDPSEARLIRITIINKPDCITGKMMLSTFEHNYETYEFGAIELNNHSIFSDKFSPHGVMYTEFKSNEYSSTYSMKIYQEIPSKVLIERNISISQSYADYIAPLPTDYPGQQINIYVVFTRLW